MPDKGTQKPSQTEEEYFAREEAEKKRKLALQVKKEMAGDEARRLPRPDVPRRSPVPSLSERGLPAAASRSPESRAARSGSRRQASAGGDTSPG